MNKAFLFDMDGVLVDSERIWAIEEHEFMAASLGELVANKIGSTMGVSINTVHEKAVEYGASIGREEFVKMFDDKASSIYSRAKLTDGTNTLIEHLVSSGFRIGLVSASRKNGIARVLWQLPFRDKFEVVISINDSGLPSKPAPDGFLQALKQLNADPGKSIVLEDSNKGISSGKSAGCYVIGFRGLLADGYEQAGADAYANTMEEVVRIVTQRSLT